MRLWAICCSIVFVLGGSFALADSTETFSTYLKNLGALSPLIGNELVPVVQPGGAAFQATSLGVAKTILGSTVTNGHCAGFNSAGLIVDEGGPCTTGGGGGTVTAGSTNQLAYYPSSAATVSGLTDANNGVLTTNGSGVPAWLTGGTSQFLTLNGSGTVAWATPPVSAGTINQLAYYAGSGSVLSGLSTGNNCIYLTNGSGVPSCSNTLNGSPNLATTSLVYKINNLPWTGTSANDDGGGFTNTYLGNNAGPQGGTGYTSSGALGSENVSIGFENLGSLTTGTANQSIGGGAGLQVTTGGLQTLIGRHASRNDHSGSNNVIIGEFAHNGNLAAFGVFNFTGSVSNANPGVLTITAITGTPIVNGMHIGGAGIASDVCEIVSFGTGTGGTGTYNLDCNTGTIASEAMTAYLADATESVLIGSNAGNTVADPQTFGFSYAQATAVGYNAYASGFTGQQNSAFGAAALSGGAGGVTGSFNTAIGSASCGSVTSGAQNTCLGASNGSALSTGSGNQIIGLQSGNSLTSGGSNTFVGNQSGYSVTTGSSNIFLGNSGFAGPGLTTGSFNVIIGNISSGISASLANAIVIGDGQNNIQADYGKTNSGGWTLQGKTFLPSIGTDATKTDATVCEDTTTHQLYFGSGTAGICLGTSSLRFKHDVASLDVGLSQVMALEPISYKVNSDHGDPNKTLYGFSAEQGGEALPTLMGRDTEGKPNTFDYMGVVPVLVKAIQQQQAEIDDLKRQLEASRH